jgi:hypothetical protein
MALHVALTRAHGTCMPMRAVPHPMMSQAQPLGLDSGLHVMVAPLLKTGMMQCRLRPVVRAELELGATCRAGTGMALKLHVRLATAPRQ